MPANSIDNERGACDAVARVLEERNRAMRANPRSPEDERVGPPMEYVFDLAGQTYAVDRLVPDAGRYVVSGRRDPIPLSRLQT
jgi:hypothetical protein